MHTASAQTLPRWPFSFDLEKAIEAVIFVGSRLSKPTLHSVSKSLFHADKAHLGRYGRPISGDHYVAMKHGPVPSATYDMFKALRGDGFWSLPERATRAIEIVNWHEVVIRAVADEGVLSESDRECLTESVRVIEGKSFAQRSDESHGPAWNAADDNEEISLDLFLLEVENSAELRAHFASSGT